MYLGFLQPSIYAPVYSTPLQTVQLAQQKTQLIVPGQLDKYSDLA